MGDFIALIRNTPEIGLGLATDGDADRYGIVDADGGFIEPNYILALLFDYLVRVKKRTGNVARSVATSHLVDAVAKYHGLESYETPVGFKYIGEFIRDDKILLGGEESAGASFLRRDGRCWTTDKDGLLLGLLAAEITATTGSDPGKRYEALTARYGAPCYQRVDLPATPEEKQALKQIDPETVEARELAGEPILAKLTRAPGNGESIGGLKVTAKSGWFAVRPSGTENICKIYAESFRGEEHLETILAQAREILSRAVGGGG